MGRSESGRVGQRTRLDEPSGQSPCVELGEGPFLQVVVVIFWGLGFKWLYLGLERRNEEWNLLHSPVSENTLFEGDRLGRKEKKRNFFRFLILQYIYSDFLGKFWMKQRETAECKK